MADIRAPRRLSREARREQLVEAAMPVVADQGLTGFSLEDVAARADVTRNLLYHYFPRVRPDIAVAVVDRAGRELTGDWVTEESRPLPERLAANFRRMSAHALAPTDAWRIHRRARTVDQPELREITERYVATVISSVSLNHLGTRTPPPLVRLALNGFLAFAETALDEARETNAPPAQVMQLLSDTLVATIQSARTASSGEAARRRLHPRSGIGESPDSA
jgi:AcrR family transcriptional regulator